MGVLPPLFRRAARPGHYPDLPTPVVHPSQTTYGIEPIQPEPYSVWESYLDIIVHFIILMWRKPKGDIKNRYYNVENIFCFVENIIDKDNRICYFVIVMYDKTYISNQEGGFIPQSRFSIFKSKYVRTIVVLI